MIRPQNSFWTLPWLHEVTAPEVKNKSYNWRKHREKKVFQLCKYTPKKFLKFPKPNISPLGPPKSQNDPKI